MSPVLRPSSGQQGHRVIANTARCGPLLPTCGAEWLATLR
jgi:hypothetical protein